jgi:multiple sugar transport system permease protein
MAQIIDLEVPTKSRTARPERRRTSRARREATWGYVFISPWVVGLLVFTAIPIVASLVLSMTNYDLLRPENTQFVFLDNFFWAANDPSTVTSAYNTVKFAVLTIPMGILTALVIALLVNHKLLAGKRVFRTLFFIPIQIPITASVFMWLGFIIGTQGVPLAWLQTTSMDIGTNLSGLPLIGSLAGVWPTGWFSDPTWTMPLLILMGVWGVGNMALIFLAGLQNVPTELHEAARVDGAGPWRAFRNVTIPMISPMLFYNLLLSVIGTAGYFTQAYVLGGSTGAPNQQILLYNVNLYNVAWNYNSMGRGCALAWIMFAVVLAIAVLLFRTANSWVYYAGAER